MEQGDFNKTIVLAVGGMTCHMCIEHVKKALTGVPGVISADVALDPPQATVTISLDAATIVDDLIAAVHEAGYDASVLV